MRHDVNVNVDIVRQSSSNSSSTLHVGRTRDKSTNDKYRLGLFEVSSMTMMMTTWLTWSTRSQQLDVTIMTKVICVTSSINKHQRMAATSTATLLLWVFKAASYMNSLHRAAYMHITSYQNCLTQKHAAKLRSIYLSVLITKHWRNHSTVRMGILRA